MITSIEFANESRFGQNVEVKKRQKIPAPEQFISILLEHDMQNHAEVYKKMLEMCQAFRIAGGQALLVGGSVRDMILGKIPKDFDLEVYGLIPEQIENIALSFGKVSDVGKAFGILKVSFGKGIDIDLSLPRYDSKIGVGHRGFEVKADPFMSIAEAAKRRDFTINSVAADPLTSEIYDYYGGIDDIKNKVLRVTDQERFRDDPLRIMRAIQFVGRMGLSIERESKELMISMVSELKELPKERFYEEWKKLLLKSPQPSLGLNAAMELGVLQEIHPEFPPLAETAQEKEWHPEGNVWQHTLFSVDKAAEIMHNERLNEEESLVLMFGSLCHDLGKQTTTEFKDGRIKSHGHEQAGEEPTKKFLAKLGVPNEIREKVIKVVINHLAPSTLFINETVRKEKASDGAIRRLANRIHPATIRELALVSKADHLGRGPFVFSKLPNYQLYPDNFPAGDWLVEKARELQVEKSKPLNLLRGQELIDLGLVPGKAIGEIIDIANRLRDDLGFTHEQVLKIIQESSVEASPKLKSGIVLEVLQNLLKI